MNTFDLICSFRESSDYHAEGEEKEIGGNEGRATPFGGET
jgi:hypothetical protein